MDDALVDTVTTNKNGRVYVPLSAGHYYALEIETAPGFKLDNTPHYFEITDNETTALTITNEPFSGIIIHKVDSVTGEGLYEVKFLLYDENKNPLGERPASRAASAVRPWSKWRDLICGDQSGGPVHEKNEKQRYRAGCSPRDQLCTVSEWF